MKFVQNLRIICIKRICLFLGLERSEVRLKIGFSHDQVSKKFGWIINLAIIHPVYNYMVGVMFKNAILKRALVRQQTNQPIVPVRVPLP